MYQLAISLDLIDNRPLALSIFIRYLGTHWPQALTHYTQHHMLVTVRRQAGDGEPIRALEHFATDLFGGNRRLTLD